MGKGHLEFAPAGLSKKAAQAKTKKPAVEKVVKAIKKPAKKPAAKKAKKG